MKYDNLKSNFLSYLATDFLKQFLVGFSSDDADTDNDDGIVERGGERFSSYRDDLLPQAEAEGRDYLNDYYKRL